MPMLVIDGVEKIEVDPTKHLNEVNTLLMLRRGFISLTIAVKNRESRYSASAAKMKFAFFGATSDEELEEQRLVSCFFHWFGVSVCNYARLVGFLRGLEQGQFTRADLNDPSKFKDISRAIKEYVESIPELRSVLIWRHKVGGHFAITDPYPSDNIATLNMSVMHHVSIENGLYYVGAMQLTQSGPTGTHTSALPQWSLTQAFVDLTPRFWPDIRIEEKPLAPPTA
jgi:hypothetical protein